MTDPEAALREARERIRVLVGEDYPLLGALVDFEKALRAALAATPSPDPDPDIEAMVDYIVQRYGGALDRLGDTPSPALDVDRLARVIDDLDDIAGNGNTGDGPKLGLDYGTAQEWAEAIAARYDR